MTLFIPDQLAKFGALRLLPIAEVTLLWSLGGLTGAEALTFIALFGPLALLSLGIRANPSVGRGVSAAKPSFGAPLALVHRTLVLCGMGCIGAFAWRFTLTSALSALLALVALEAAACFLFGLTIAPSSIETRPLTGRPSGKGGLVADLLGALFNSEELRRWISQDVDAALAHELPSVASTHAELCAAVAALLQRTGWLNGGIFELLARARPLQRARIDAVAEQWITLEKTP